jgi:predicted TIM-barrel fold metal-dependent hydrolase
MGASRVVAGLIVLFATAAASGVRQAPSREPRPPIIDMHMHAMPLDYHGTPPPTLCADEMPWEWVDPKAPPTSPNPCPGRTLTVPSTEDELIRSTVALMEQFNVIGVVSAATRGGVNPTERLKRWEAAAPGRIIPAVLTNGSASIDLLRTLAKDGTIRVLGELTFQYLGYDYSDPVAERHFALAEEFDLPVGVHAGPGAPGEPNFKSPRYRARLGSPLRLEEPLLRHPKMRLYVMHAGWPLLDEMLALLYSHDQVNVDVGVISWVVPRAEFHSHLRRLVEAGFGKRVMFGSDLMIWPDTLRLAIEAIESAAFLSAEQKRDIFYNNAARFLRLSSEDVARHHGKAGGRR